MAEQVGGGPGRLFGIETEYGILVEDRGAGDLMEESRLLVRAYSDALGRPWAGPWDYRVEDPRRDMRGFQVDRLSYDEQDAQFDRAPSARNRHLSAEEERADRVLTNGARLYNDHGHPEYSTPECRTLRDLVAHDRAGAEILLACAHRRAAEIERDVSLFKNNTDFHGASYGTHEGYLAARSVPFETLLQGMLPFLVTRPLFAGAGKTGVETGGPFEKECQFQLSQRADFFTEIASVDTLARRPIFNTRDEAHADPRAHRRVHVISGDANMSEWATAMKVGTTCVVLELIESGWEPLFRLRDPVGAIKKVSRDPSLRWVLELEDGRTMRATDLQRIYLRDAQRLLAGSGPDIAWTLREWERVLNDLDADWRTTADRVDWAAKRSLLESFIEAEGVWWEDPMLRSLDLEYHHLDPERGLFLALEEAGEVVRLSDPEFVSCATVRPPADTRAALRGALVERFSAEIDRLSWGRVGLRAGSETRWVSLPAEWGAAPTAEAGADGGLPNLLRAAKTVEEALVLLGAGGG
jgi:proteasome accessory factor A